MISPIYLLVVATMVATVSAQSFEINNTYNGVVLRVDGTLGLEAWNGTSLESVFEHIQRLESAIDVLTEGQASLQRQLDVCDCDRQLYAVREFVTKWNKYDNDMPETLPANMTEACDITYFKCDVNHDVNQIMLINGNEFGSIPTAIGYLSHLTRVYLKNFKCQSNTNNVFPSQVSQLGLRSISIINPLSTQCNLGTELSGMNSITSLSISQFVPTDLSGEPFPLWIADLPQLSDLNLPSAGITGTLPSELFVSSALKTLGLTTNSIQSPIPSEIAQLEAVNLFSNDITGTLPSEIFSSSTLTSLSLGFNAIAGNLPTINMPNLNVFQINHNIVFGDLPQLNTPSLAYLYMQNCEFTGQIPSEYGTLTNLVYLNLQHNDLSGQVPSLNSLVNLSTCYLNGNSGLLCDNASLPPVCETSYTCPTTK